MSGMRDHELDWQDQLGRVKAGLANQGTASGGYVSNRHRRKTKDVSEGIIFKGVEYHKDSQRSKSRDSTNVYHSELMPGNVESIFADPENSQGHTVGGIDNGAVEIFMRNNHMDSPSSGDEDSMTSLRKESHHKKPEGEEVNQDEISEEEKEARKKQEQRNRAVEKFCIWTTLGVAAAAVTTGGIAVMFGLLGRHRSNINNM